MSQTDQAWKNFRHLENIFTPWLHFPSASILLGKIRPIPRCSAQLSHSVGCFSSLTFPPLDQSLPHLCLHDALINWIVLSFILDCPLLMHRDAVNFCVLIMYSATLLKLFISYSICLCVYSLGFSTKQIISNANTVLLLPFQPRCLLFLFLFNCPDWTPQ